MNKELKLKKIDELIKELTEYKLALKENLPYFESKNIDNLLYDRDKNLGERLPFNSNKIKIEYGEFDKENSETLLMSKNKSLYARNTFEGYIVADEEGKFIISPKEELIPFLLEIKKKFIIEDKYILELCKLNEYREIIIDFMKDYDFNSLTETPGNIRFDFDFNYISFQYGNDGVEVIDPSNTLFEKFKTVCPEAILSSISPLCF